MVTNKKMCFLIGRPKYDFPKPRCFCLAFLVIRISYTVNVLKLRTLKNNYFSAVRNFRNYVSEKVLVFVILECGLYHELKRYICM